MIDDDFPRFRHSCHSGRRMRARGSNFRLVKILPLRIEVFEYMPTVFANHAKNSKNSSRRRRGAASRARYPGRVDESSLANARGVNRMLFRGAKSSIDIRPRATDILPVTRNDDARGAGRSFQPVSQSASSARGYV